MRSLMPLTNTIIYLIGFAGVGKYTVAKALAENDPNIKLVDNHLINNPIFSIIHTDGTMPIPEEVWDKVAVIRNTVFDTIRTVSPKSFSFVFTNELIAGEARDIPVYQAVEALVVTRESTFLPVRLICSEEALCGRVVTVERKHRLKANDATVASQKYRSAEVFYPPHPNTITLDTTNISVAEVSGIIYRKAKHLSGRTPC